MVNNSKHSRSHILSGMHKVIDFGLNTHEDITEKLEEFKEANMWTL